MTRLTASGLDRVVACAGSVALPQFPYVGADAEHGTIVHRFLERANQAGRAVALGELDDPDNQAKCAAIDFDAIPAGAEPEVAFAYDPESDTAERLVLGGARRYPDDGRIYGTADLVGARDGAAFVGDFKTGSMKVRARAAMQLRFLALAAARVAGIDEAHVAMLYLRHDGSWFTDRATFDALDLDATRADLLDLQARAREAVRAVSLGGLPQLVPGPHCDHCAAAPKCPAQERLQAALVEAAEAPADLVTWFGGLDEARAGAMAEQAIVVAKLAEKVREAANERVRAHGDLALPSGRTLKRCEVNAQVQSQRAKERLGALKETLREEGEIATGKTIQIRVVGARKAS